MQVTLEMVGVSAPSLDTASNEIVERRALAAALEAFTQRRALRQISRFAAKMDAKVRLRRMLASKDPNAAEQQAVEIERRRADAALGGSSREGSPKRKSRPTAAGAFCPR